MTALLLVQWREKSIWICNGSLRENGIGRIPFKITSTVDYRRLKQESPVELKLFGKQINQLKFYSLDLLLPRKTSFTREKFGIWPSNQMIIFYIQYFNIFSVYFLIIHWRYCAFCNIPAKNVEPETNSKLRTICKLTGLDVSKVALFGLTV